MMNKLIWIVLVVFLLAACKDAETIEQSTVNRWTQVIEGNYQEAYDYLSPAYREVESLNAYMLRLETAKLKVKWVAAKFLSKDCSEDACTIKVDLEYKYTFPQRAMGEIQLSTEVIENWIKLDGRWYLVPSDKQLL